MCPVEEVEPVDSMVNAGDASSSRDDIRRWWAGALGVNEGIKCGKDIK
jgi:hypothetical protein